MLVPVVSVVLQHFLALSRCCGTSWTWRRAPSMASLEWLLLLGCPQTTASRQCPRAVHDQPPPGHTRLVLSGFGWPWGGMWELELFPCACLAALGEVGGGGWPGWRLPGHGECWWL